MLGRRQARALEGNRGGLVTPLDLLWLVGADLRVVGTRDVWSAGDCAAVPDLTRPGARRRRRALSTPSGRPRRLAASSPCCMANRCWMRCGSPLDAHRAGHEHAALAGD